MPPIAASVFNAVRALVDDPEGDYATDAYQVPFLNIAQEDFLQELVQNPNIGKYKKEVIILLPAGTTSFFQFFATAAPLDGLEQILSMREKPSGQPDYQYVDMEEVDDLPVAGIAGFNYVYLFNGEEIRVAGANQDLDVRIYGAFDPPLVVDGTSAVLPAAEPYLKYAVSAMVARAHGNKELAVDLSGQALRSMANIMNNIILQMQQIPLRQRPFNTDDNGWNWIA